MVHHIIWSISSKWKLIIQNLKQRIENFNLKSLFCYSLNSYVFDYVEIVLDSRDHKYFLENEIFSIGIGDIRCFDTIKLNLIKLTKQGSVLITWLGSIVSKPVGHPVVRKHWGWKLWFRVLYFDQSVKRILDDHFCNGNISNRANYRNQ